VLDDGAFRCESEKTWTYHVGIPTGVIPVACNQGALAKKVHEHGRTGQTHWWVLTMAFSLMLPSSMAFLSTGTTLVHVSIAFSISSARRRTRRDERDR
jgi:hypothetical protein